MGFSIDENANVARAFGAKVEIESAGRVLCLVVGEGSPIAAINAVQGTVAAMLSAKRMLAVIDLDRLQTLKRQPGIVTAGPVSIDQGRFAQFAQLVGARSNP